MIISDTGNLKNDISQFIQEKRSNVLVKFVNFCNVNFFAPLHVKLRVLDTCVASSLSYGSETWANFGDEIETIYRCGLREALGIRPNTNNEIVYVESQRFPVRCRIARQQLKFWLVVDEYVNNNPNSALRHFLDIALQINLPYIEHYKRLHRNYDSPMKCLDAYKKMFKDRWKLKFDRACADVDSKLATYQQVNPTLSEPPYLNKILIETDRILLTRFRCGSHSLLIETGRFVNIPRNDRVCLCGTGVQNILHCFSVCPLTLPLLTKRYMNLKEVFDDENICDLLHAVCKTLKIKI